jgi:hypothetical protein
MPAYERLTAIRPGVGFETWLRGCPQVSRLLMVRLWLRVWTRYLILWLDLEVLIGRAVNLLFLFGPCFLVLEIRRNYACDQKCAPDFGLHVVKAAFLTIFLCLDTTK